MVRITRILDPLFVRFYFLAKDLFVQNFFVRLEMSINVEHGRCVLI